MEAAGARPASNPPSRDVEPLTDPCLYSPGEAQAKTIAEYYARKFRGCSRVLDVGFGQGYFLEAARRLGIDAIGLDRDDALVQRARARDLDARAGDVAQLADIVPERLDGAIAAHLIEHLAPDDVRRLLSSLGQAVSPGGLLVLVTPNMEDLRVATHWFWLDPTHVRPYPAGALKHLMDPAQWTWAGEGYDPAFLTRDTPKVLLNRMRYGRNYGRAGRWFALRRG